MISEPISGRTVSFGWTPAMYECLKGKLGGTLKNGGALGGALFELSASVNSYWGETGSLIKSHGQKRVNLFKDFAKLIPKTICFLEAADLVATGDHILAAHIRPNNKSTLSGFDDFGEKIHQIITQITKRSEVEIQWAIFPFGTSLPDQWNTLNTQHLKDALTRRLQNHQAAEVKPPKNRL